MCECKEEDRIPATDMWQLYLILQDFFAIDVHLAMAQETARRSVSKRLAERFRRSVEQFRPYCNVDESFYPKDRHPIPAPEQLRKIESTYTLSGLLVHQQQEVGQVINAPQLNFRYIDREIISARTTGGARYTDGRSATSGKRLDWLLANAEDRRPIIAEIKVGTDKNPFYALIQTLMYAAELVTLNQATRLQRQYGQIHFPELDNPQEDTTPAVDIYLILSGYDHEDKDRSELLQATERISANLMTLPAVTSHVRRIACLEADLNTEGELIFQSRFCLDRFNAPA